MHAHAVAPWPRCHNDACGGDDPLPNDAWGAEELCCGLSVHVNVYDSCLRETFRLQNEAGC